MFNRNSRGVNIMKPPPILGGMNLKDNLIQGIRSKQGTGTGITEPQLMPSLGKNSISKISSEPMVIGFGKLGKKDVDSKMDEPTAKGIVKQGENK